VLLGPPKFLAFSVKDFFPACDCIPVQTIDHKIKSIAATMKTPLLTTLALAAASFLTTAAFSQSTWQTVDDFQYAPGKGAGPFGVTATPGGTIFVSGAAADATDRQHGFVNRSTDGGATWDLVFDLPGDSSANCFALAAAPSGALWATSVLNATNWLTHWSIDGGATWVLSDRFRGTGRYATPFCTTVDPAGRIFVGGNVWDSQGRQHFTVRRSIDGGATWKTVDDLAGAVSGAWGITATPSAVLAVGRLSNLWLVRRSADGGNTWVTTDKFQQTSFAYGAAADLNGNFYVVGAANLTVNKVTQLHWLTRKSTDNGSTWSTVDDFFPGATAMARGVTVDAFGRVFVSGSSPAGHTVRGSLDGGATWATTDTFRLTPTGSANAVAIDSDGNGNVFAVGQVVGADGNGHTIVRKLGTP